MVLALSMLLWNVLTFELGLVLFAQAWSTVPTYSATMSASPRTQM